MCWLAVKAIESLLGCADVSLFATLGNNSVVCRLGVR